MPTKTTIEKNEDMLEKIFEQVSMLRREVSLLLPEEDVEEFEHVDRIKQSYHSAIKKHSLMYGNEFLIYRL